MESSRSKSLKSLAAAGVIAALVITAIAYVASGPAPQPQVAAPAAPAATEKADISTIVWHDTPAPAPMTVFKDVNNTDQTLANFKGKVLLVNFWATFCAPCVKEMPTLDALQVKMGGPEFQVVAIAQDREGARLSKPFAEKQEWKNLAFYAEAPGKFMRDAKLNGIPTTLIIDKSGNEVARVEGDFDWNSPAVEKILRDLMAKS